MSAPFSGAQKTRNSRPIEILSPDEAMALLGACSARSSTGLRNRALIVLGWRGGLRIGEALSLSPRDLDPNRGAVNVRSGKGGAQRMVGLDPTAFWVVQCWLERRAAIGLGAAQPLICTLRGQPLQQSYVRALMPRLARRAGIEKRTHFHGLRHTHAAELARECVPINQIQMQLGHANLATTDAYLRRVSPRELLSTISARDWAA